MTPAKPRPLVRPCTSTYWPGKKCFAVICVPAHGDPGRVRAERAGQARRARRRTDGQQGVGGDLELGEALARADASLLEMLEERLGRVFPLGLAGRHLQGVVALLLGRLHLAHRHVRQLTAR
jgi:hypothetical protein